MKKTIFVFFATLLFSPVFAQKVKFDQCLLSAGVATGLSTYNHWRDPHRIDEFTGKINTLILNPSVMWKITTRWVGVSFGPTAELYCSSQAAQAIGVNIGVEPIFNRSANYQVLTITGGCYESIFANYGTKSANQKVNGIIFSTEAKIAITKMWVIGVGAFTHVANGGREIVPQVTLGLRLWKSD